jgi:hypothetical protein
VLSTNPIAYEEVESLLWSESAAPVAEGRTKAADRHVRPINATSPEQ